MAYSPSKPPSVSDADAQALAAYLTDELQVLASALRGVDSTVYSVSNAAPVKPRTGTVIYADGTNWNPGSGEGLYVYSAAGSWVWLEDNPAAPVFSSEIGKIEFWPTTVVQAGRLKANGQSFLRATYPALLAFLVRSGTATFTNGSSSVGMALHALSVGDPIKLFTGGTLPTNFTAGTHGLPTVGTNYFVKAVVNANTVTLSATVGGTAIVAGSAGSGAHTWVNAPSGDGDGSTTATVPDLRGVFPRGWNDDASIDSNRTIGDTQLDAMQGHKHSATDLPWAASQFLTTAASGVVSVDLTSSTSIVVGSPTTDGVNGTPRTAAETRPRNVSLMATIRYSA